MSAIEVPHIIVPDASVCMKKRLKMVVIPFIVDCKFNDVVLERHCAIT